jgi:uncharacterized membrane protein YjgN (DUF898 family)
MSTAVPTVGPGTAATANRITWVDPPGGFLGLSLLNSALRILTLGVYHFWGKTEVRQRIWSAVRIDGEPVEYRGTGGELFRGFIIVFALVLLPLGVLTFAAPLIWAPNSPMQGLVNFVAWLLIFTLWGLGIHRARRYRLSRTRWRGIRAGLSGRSGSFAWTYLWTTLLVPLTLGWILPWRAARLQRALFNDTHFGDKAFTFTGRAGPLYARFWLVWLSAILLFFVASVPIGMLIAAAGGGLGQVSIAKMTWAQIAQLAGVVLVALLVFAIIRAWYSSRMLNYFAAETRYQGAGFRLGATVPSLIWLVATNYLMRVLSLGVLSPIAEARTMRYIVERLSLEGSVDLQAIGQNPDALLTRGEGLAEAFNVDAF